MNPLVSRKKLLVAESELNRAQLVEEWQTLAEDFHSLKDRAQKLGTLASLAASLITVWRSFRQQKSAPAAEKPGWLQNLVKGAGLAASLWSQFRPQGTDPKNDQKPAS